MFDQNLQPVNPNFRPDENKEKPEKRKVAGNLRSRSASKKNEESNGEKADVLRKRIGSMPESQDLQQVQGSKKKLFKDMVFKVINERRKKKEQNRPSFVVKMEDAINVVLELTKGGGYRLINFYWPELIDRRHHYGFKIADFFDQWKEETRNGGPSFNDWLDQVEARQSMPGYVAKRGEMIIKEVPKMVYLEPHEREAYKLKLDEQGLMRDPITQKLYHTVDRDTPQIFVVSMDGEMYVATKRRGDVKKNIASFNHSSFVCGGTVASAGAFFTENGKITKIKDTSGHYIEPNMQGVEPLPLKDRIKMMVTALEILKNKGVELKGIEVTLDFKKYDAEAFFERYREQ